MADDATATARRRGRSPAQPRLEPTFRPAVSAKSRRMGRRRGGHDVRPLGRFNPWRWLPALRRGADRARRSIGARFLMPPRERPIRVALPAIESAADIAGMLDAITAEVRRGAITPAEAASLAEVADVYVRALETREFDRRLRALETAHAAAS
jgi:hypothetical protein